MPDVQLYECECGWIGAEAEMGADYVFEGEMESSFICPRCRNWFQLDDYRKVSERALLTFNRFACPPPQVVAICARCGKQCRWAVQEFFISGLSFKVYDSLDELSRHEPSIAECVRRVGDREWYYRRSVTLNSVERCYHCKLLFSPQWHWESGEVERQRFEL